MKPRSLVLITGFLLTIGVVLCALAITPPTPAASRVRWDSTRTLGAPRTFRNLTLIPIYDSSARAVNTYLTLDEGLKAKVVKVKEARGGGEVNTLFISNTGKKPLYVMAGEVVLGGQQDRCLGRDTIVPPGKRNMPITVFCVEHGRWTGRAEFGDTAVAAASPDIRVEAQEAAFQAGRPAASAGQARAQSVQSAAPPAPAAVGMAQQKVWDKVAAKNRRFQSENATGTYREVLNLKGGNTRTGVAPYLKALGAGPEREAGMVGVVAAVNGKITAADVFGDPALFRKLWPKLLRSYASDAAERAPSRATRFPAVTAGQAKTFLVTATDAKTRMENRSDVSTSLRLDAPTTRAYLLMPASKAAGGGGLGGAVHGSILRK